MSADGAIMAADVEGGPSRSPRSLTYTRPPDVSICIVNWNCRGLLRQCLRSIRAQAQGVEVETIVVDNGSRDGAADMVAREFPEVVLIRNEKNEGFSRANNQAARRARGRYLFFLNNDTMVPPRSVRILVDFLDAHPGAGLVGPRLRGIDGQVQVSCRPRPTVTTFLHRTLLLGWTGLCRGDYRRFRRDHFDPDTTRPVDVLMGAAVLASRQRFLAWGGWDEDFTFGGEDLELCFRINQHAPVLFCAEAEILHYGRVSTRAHSEFSSPHIAVGFLKYLRKTGASRPALWGYKLAVTLDAPLQCLVRTVQFVWRRLRGRRSKAEQSLRAARAAAHFLTRGLRRFWRA